MQDLVASYLFQYKKCPLPAVGTLFIKRNESLVIAGEKKITAPTEAIVFSGEEASTSDFESFIAAQKSVTKEEAAYQLKRYCDELKNIATAEKMLIPGTGEFYVDADNYLAFLPAVIPSFHADIFAERVIHPDKTHAILVGDTETTNAIMTEYFAEEPPKVRSRWWIFGIVFFVLAAAVIIFYLNDSNGNSSFGTAHKNEIKAASDTYRKVP